MKTAPTWLLYSPFAPMVALTMIGMRVAFVAHDELKRYAQSPLK